MSAHERPDCLLIALSLFLIALAVLVACTSDDFSLVSWLIILGALATLASQGLRVDRIGRLP